MCRPRGLQSLAPRLRGSWRRSSQGNPYPAAGRRRPPAAVPASRPVLSGCARPGRPPGCQRDTGRGKVQPHPLHADPPLPSGSFQSVGRVYDIGHNALNRPPASAGDLGVIQGRGPWPVFLEVLLEEAALSMDRPGGGPRTDVSSAAQGESGCGGKRGWALGCPAHGQVLEARMRMVAFTHRHGAVRQYSRRYPVCEALRALPGMGPPLPGLPEGPRINKSMGARTRSPNPPAPVSSSEGVRRRGAFLTLFMAGAGGGGGATR